MPSPAMIYASLTLVPPEKCTVVTRANPLPSIVTCNIDQGIRSYSDYTQVCRCPLLRCKHVDTSNA